MNAIKMLLETILKMIAGVMFICALPFAFVCIAIVEYLYYNKADNYMWKLQKDNVWTYSVGIGTYCIDQLDAVTYLACFEYVGDFRAGDYCIGTYTSINEAKAACEADMGK